MAIVRHNQSLVIPARFAGRSIAPGDFTDIPFRNRRAGAAFANYGNIHVCMMLGL